MWQPNNNSPAGRGAMGQQQQQPPQPQLAGGPPPLSSLQQQQMMMQGGYDPRYYGGHPPPYGMHAQQMGMMQGVPPGGMRYNPMQQQGPNVGRVGGGPGGYGFVPGGPMMQQGPGIPQQYNNSPAGRGAMGQQQQQPPRLAGGPPPLSSLQQQQMMMHGGYDPRYYGGHPPPYGMHAQQMGMMPMQQQGPNVGRVGGGPGGYGFVPGGPMMQQGPGIPQQYNNQGGQGRGGVQHYPMVQPGMNRGFAVGGGVVSPTASVPPPREKKVLVITDKNGNPIDFGKGKKTPATSITPSPTTVSGSDAAAAPIDGVASSDAVVADGGVADVEDKVSSLQIAELEHQKMELESNLYAKLMESKGKHKEDISSNQSPALEHTVDNLRQENQHLSTELNESKSIKSILSRESAEWQEEKVKLVDEKIKPTQRIYEVESTLFNVCNQKATLESQKADIEREISTELMETKGKHNYKKITEIQVRLQETVS
jgi:hypothetical protein